MRSVKSLSSLIEKVSPHHLLLLCGINAALRLAFMVLVQPEIKVAEDFNIAQHIVAGQGFSIYDRGPTTAKGPFYPLYLAFWLWVLGEKWGLFGAILLQHFLAAAIPWLLYLLGRTLRREALGKGAALLFLLHPSYFYHPTVAENTTWVVFLGALWGIWLFQYPPEKYPFRYLSLLGVLLGLFLLEKPILVPPMVASLILRFYRRLKAVGIVGLTSLVVILPWSVRNYWVFGTFLPTKSYAGVTTFPSSWLPFMAAHPRYAVSDSLEAIYDSLFALPEAQAYPGFRALARHILQERWHQIPERTLFHALIYWSIPPRYWGNLSLSFFIVRLLPVSLLLVLFLWGSFYLWQKDRYFLLAILGTLLWTTFIYALNQVLNIRYKLEVEWLQLYICAAPLVFKRPHG
ncbi:MAG: hypothetical protein N3A68_00665 [Bacteroidia bacterium]|jgi:hypothetical protein|nr:hypothetical protein [Bacteroidia bacterium]